MLAQLLQLTLAERALLAAQLAVMAAVAVHGVYRFLLVRAALRAGPPEPPPAAAGERLPVVTVQLPLYNEAHVVERLLVAVGAIDWPRDRLEVQVLDDSTDATRLLAAAGVERLRSLGVDAHHLHRPARDGFKAGALAFGLERSRGELVAIFDADFVPPPGLLRAVAPHFHDPRVGMVQARWGHGNRQRSLLTRIQAVLLDGHFLVEHRARAARNHFFNFNGTAGVWRRSAIDDAGGWQADTLTEDLDLSYRAQLRGWRFVYRPDLVAPAELPEDINAFKGQQHRWAKGSAQSAVKLLPGLLRAPLKVSTRIEAAFHLTGNFGYVLLLAMALLTVPTLSLRQALGWRQLVWLDLPFLLLATVSVGVFYAAPLSADGGPGRRWLLLPALMALGIGMSLNNSRAVLAGLFGRPGEFRRTPKRGDARRPRYRARLDPWVLAEAALGLYLLGGLLSAARSGPLTSLPFLALFAAGFLMTAGLSLAAARTRAPSAPRAQRRRERSSLVRPA